MAPRFQPIAARFQRKFVVNQQTRCWEWTSTKIKYGYGRMNIGGRKFKWILAHRLSWELHFGEIPDGTLVCHRCDNPCCVNPNHLFLGTHMDNCQDKIRKGRARYSR